MTVTESDRLEMHLEFRKILGDKVADTMMEHLPPVGWGGVARTADIQRLELQISEVRSEISDMRSDLKASVRSLAAGMWAMGTISSACFIAIFTILATKL